MTSVGVEQRLVVPQMSRLRSWFASLTLLWSPGDASQAGPKRADDPALCEYCPSRASRAAIRCCWVWMTPQS